MRLTSAALAATLALAAPAAGRPPLYRSPDGNTVTIELFNRGAATWAAGRSGSSGARTAYTTTASLNDGFPMDLLVDTGAMGLCIIQQEIDWMLSGVNHFGKPSLFPSDYRGRAVIETAGGQRLIRDKWNIREVYAFGFVLHNVEAVSCGKNGSLLGQGVLARFKSWSIDNEKGTITVVGPPINGEAVRLKKSAAYQALVGVPQSGQAGLQRSPTVQCSGPSIPRVCELRSAPVRANCSARWRACAMPCMIAWASSSAWRCRHSSSRAGERSDTVCTPPQAARQARVSRAAVRRIFRGP